MANPQETRRNTRVTISRRERVGVTAAAAIFAATTTGLIGYVVGRENSDPAIDPSGAGTVEPGTMPSISPAGNVDVQITPAPSTANPENTGNVVSVESAASAFGRDEWSQDSVNWASVENGGWVLNPNPNGLNSVVEVHGVGQAYLDAKVAGKYQAIALIVPDGETFPVRGITVYPNDADANRAFDGALDLENRTQPGVYLAEVCDTMQALPENKQDLSNPAQWEAEKITSEEAASRFGKDDWSQNPENWQATPDGYGMILAVNPNGSNSVINTEDAVAQAYWDAKVAGKYQAIAVTLGVGVEIPVRGATVYAGVPEGMKNAAVDFAFQQAVNLEIEEQPEVFVGQVCKTAQAGQTSANVTPEATIQPTATATPEPTARPTAKPTSRPEATPRVTEKPWYADNVKEIGNKGTTKLLPDGGLKIKAASEISIQVDKGEKAIYWNGTKVVTVNGPVTIKTAEATIYKR